jgi:methylenetetrahydrofolate dehydrogenase (NADP+)/methenyltetrahydrofolate cyclohydrolase
VTATLLDGNALAKQIQAEIAADIAAFHRQTGVQPCLAAVLVGDNAASEVYVRKKQQACQKVGISNQLRRLPATATESDLLTLVEALNHARQVHGILVQAPLPAAINSAVIFEAVSPVKDIDCFHPENVGRLVQGQPRFMPCTPYGVQQLLVRNGIETGGKHAVVVGRSDIVGKPMASLLVQRGPGGDATVTICHSKTRNLADITRQADILIVAIGQPRFVTPDMVRPRAVVVDVGIHRHDGNRLVGDVDFEGVRQVASHITPVPGGVGPLTVTMLLANTLRAARLQTEM